MTPCRHSLQRHLAVAAVADVIAVAKPQGQRAPGAYLDIEPMAKTAALWVQRLAAVYDF